MPYIVECSCGSRKNVPDEWQGKTVRCKCGAKLIVGSKTSVSHSPSPGRGNVSARQVYGFDYFAILNRFCWIIQERPGKVRSLQFPGNLSAASTLLMAIAITEKGTEMKVAFRLLFIVMGLLFPVKPIVQAQVTSTWNGTSGNWSDSSRWSSNPLFPNNGNGGNAYNALINGGIVNVDVPISIQGLSFGGGTIVRTQSLSLNAPFDWNFGSLTGAGSLNVEGGGTINTNALVTDGAIGFGDGVTASTIAHTNLGRLVLNNSAQATVRNAAVYEINVTSSGSNFGSATSATPGTFTVEAGGTLRKMGTGTHLITNNVSLQNAGTIELNQGGFSFENGGSLVNTGNVLVNAGNLSFQFGFGSLANDGLVSLASGGTLTGSLINNSNGILGGAGMVTGLATMHSGGEILAGIDETATTLMLLNGLVMEDNSLYVARLFSPTLLSISNVAVTGNATISANASLGLDLSALSNSQVQILRDAIGIGNEWDFTVLTTTGTISGGGFDNGSFLVTNYGAFLPAEWTFSVSTYSNHVDIAFSPLMTVPEPNGFLVLSVFVLWTVTRYRPHSGVAFRSSRCQG